jgi:hypothetical protein
MMKDSCLIKACMFFVALLASLATLAQSGATAPRDYSFSIAATQPWTDTGVDLQAGDLVEISATAHAGNGCDPRGIGAQEPALPVATAPARALIARLQEQGEAVAIGSHRQLKVDAPGHLFFGLNAASGQAAPACSGFAVRVHIAAAATSASAVTGNALALPSATSSSGPAASSSASASSSPTAASSATVQSKTTPAPDIKSKLASAAQVFLAGQFGTGASATNSSATPLSSDAAAANPAASTAAAPATPALSVSAAALDAALRKNIDDLPRRVNDQFNHQGDMVNFVLVGSQQQVQSALEAANWRVADTDNKEAVMKAVLETYQKKDYLAMPMSQLYLFGRKQDFGYELAAAYSVVASRHHFRIWKGPSTWNGQTLWAGAGTHDIGFEKDQRNGGVTHKIDPAVDGERDNIGQTLQQAGKVKSMSYYLPPDPVQGANNATGGGYHSDGRILVIVLQ